jgi:hypothetical protein
MKAKLTISNGISRKAIIIQRTTWKEKKKARLMLGNEPHEVVLTAEFRCFVYMLIGDSYFFGDFTERFIGTSLPLLPLKKLRR